MVRFDGSYLGTGSHSDFGTTCTNYAAERLYFYMIFVVLEQLVSLRTARVSKWSIIAI